MNTSHSLSQAVQRLLCCTLILFASCQLPNVGPFVDATGQLKGAVASSGSAVVAELRVMPDGDTAAGLLATSWEARNGTMGALLQYAQSIDAIVAAGKSGPESIGGVVDAVKGLADAVGVAIPGSATAVAVATDSAKFLYGQIAAMRAANSLAEALERAQPVVDAIVKKLREDMPALDDIVQAASQKIEAQIVADPEASSARDQRKLLRVELAKQRDLSLASARQELQELSTLLADVNSRYAAYETRLEEVRQRLRAARQLISATSAALDAWASAHAQLAVAARNKSAVSTGALIDATTELRGLVKRIREL